MTLPAVPAIVVSLPARTLAEARSQIVEAEAHGADLAEVRFDRFAAPERDLASTLFPSPLPLVATLRSTTEGGEGPDDPRERHRLLAELARLPFRWIDVELERDLADSLLSPSSSSGRILSLHRSTTVRRAEWSSLVREPSPPGSVRKVVVRAGIGELLRELLPELPPPGESSTVALTTGPSGPLLRAWSRRLGFPMVFASLPERRDAPLSRAAVEPSQIPVDRLRPFLSADEGGPLFGLAGHPVSHSYSPELHSRWMRRSGKVGLYVALDFASDEEFVESLSPLSERGFRGLNVTHPFKVMALESASEVAPGAAACGVANCLTLRSDGSVEAENTDLAAVLRRLDELRRSRRWDGREVAVVGTGGAARATLAAARTLGATSWVYGRDSERTASLAGEFGARTDPVDPPSPAGLVVHATTVGREGAGPLDVPIGRLIGPGTFVLDWVYDAVNPTVREQAEKRGGVYEDGTRLLVYQAAASFGVWWGEEPPETEVRRTLEEVGCAA